MGARCILPEAGQRRIAEPLLDAHRRTVHPSALRPGDIVFDEPCIDVCNLEGLTAADVDSAMVVVADADGKLYGMYLKGAEKGSDGKPHGLLQQLYAHSTLFATQSQALLAQAESEREEARNRIRLAERLEKLAAELAAQGR